MQQGDPSEDQDLPPRPQPPRDSDCCRSDCPICVFDLYERELERWREQVEELRRRHGEPPAGQGGRPPPDGLK
ncbi:MAG TPA: oxidoreductase-like domain-containing protein [Nevskia sp.]|jgi:hypothetical protein|nr:oxidoreductase-like domain-containing protein [Nevskia sp.]